jgi:hypothetical protein
MFGGFGVISLGAESFRMEFSPGNSKSFSKSSISLLAATAEGWSSFGRDLAILIVGTSFTWSLSLVCVGLAKASVGLSI